WGFEDPAAVQGNDDAQHHAFKLVFNFILTRIRYFIVLPLEKLDALATQHEMDKIGQHKNDL
ncbi:MAG: arsenate reductase ArsC, partial [Methylicorpusculum sp.]|nr:arsenate reductase ArsC [Methylicorpusculum sp.]